MTKETKPAPRWGYNKDGEAKIFTDGKLPKGWADSPAKFQTSKATK